MKIVIGSFSHESNSFNPKEMVLEDFSPIYGGEVLETLEKGGRSALQGIYRTLTSKGVEVFPTIFARATPGGLVALETYEMMKAGFLRELKKANDIAGVCLHLHGSMTVAGLGDAEGDLLTEVRKIVGSVPIVTSLDMHATITPTMLAKADAFVGYRTAPHVDTMETGEKAARILLDALLNGYQLKMAAVGLPLLVSGEQSESAKEPMVTLIRELEEMDQLENVVSSSYLLGFPWVDVSYSQGAALVVTKEDQELAEEKAIKLAEKFWAKLDQFKFTTEAYEFEEALEVALKVEKGPVCIADCGDNPGAGGGQNIVFPLQHMLARGVGNVLFGAIADPDAYAICVAQEIGTELDLTFGKMSIEPNAPGLNVKVQIKKIGKLGHMPAVAVSIGDIDVIISKDRIMMLDPKDLEKLGLNPREYRLLVLKSGYLDPKYEAIATYGLLALTPGFTNQIFSQLNYENLTRPMYPLDRNFSFNPQDYLLSSSF